MKKNVNFNYQITYQLKGKYVTCILFNEDSAIKFLNTLLSMHCDFIRVITFTPRHFTY